MYFLLFSGLRNSRLAFGRILLSSKILHRYEIEMKFQNDMDRSSVSVAARWHLSFQSGRQQEWTMNSATTMESKITSQCGTGAISAGAFSILQRSVAKLPNADREGVPV
jgi:hypothetical protein